MLNKLQQEIILNCDNQGMGGYVCEAYFEIYMHNIIMKLKELNRKNEKL